MDPNTTLSYHYMDFNFFKDMIFAFIPLLLSFYLFRFKAKYNSFGWLSVFTIFLIFLPNAPYALTDYIHLVADFREYSDKIFVIVFLLPLYIIFMFACMESYIVSLIMFARFLKFKGKEKLVLPMELILHFVSALGIYLGRFERMYSWDALLGLDLIVDILNVLFDIKALSILIGIFVFITLIYYLMKSVNMHYWYKIKRKLYDQ